MLKVYAFALLEKNRHLKRIIGIATEPPSGMGASEDLIVAEVSEWSAEFLKELEESKKKLNIVQEGNYKEHARGGSEFPSLNSETPDVSSKSRLSRQQRRAAERKARKKERRK